MCAIAIGVLIAVLVILILSLVYLPWWGTLLVLLGVLAVLGLSAKWIIKRVLLRLAMIPFESKGKALRDAGATIHSMEPAQPPDESKAPLEDEEEPDPGQTQDKPARQYYLLQATITPAPGSQGAFKYWDIDDLILVPFDLKVSRSPDDDSMDDDTCEISRVRVMIDGTYQDPEGSKFPGEQKLELLVGVKPGTKRLKFRYYFETFGDVRVP